VRRPVGWPKNIVDKKLTSGVGYFWSPTTADKNNGCLIEPRALGGDYAAAKMLADDLNKSLADWRSGLGGIKVPRAMGSVRWWLHVFETKTLAFKKLRERTQDSYKERMRYVEDLPLENPTGALRTVGDLPVQSISARATDRLYERLLQRIETKNGRDLVVPRPRQAEYEIAILKKAWDAVQRQFPEIFPVGNHFKGIELKPREKQTKKPATVEEAYALAGALADMGHPHLGAAALICFEWLQRPENVLKGAITWSGYQPGRTVRIEHWKTGVRVEHDLVDEGEQLYPELEEFLARLPKMGMPIVLWGGAPGAPRPYAFRHAHSVVAKARKRAGLPTHVTLAACRHGGMTELGDSEVTEAEGMALSAHRDPKSFRLYVKQTAKQRKLAMRKRRAWRKEAGS